MTGLILRVRRDIEDAVATHSVVELWRGTLLCMYRGYGVEHTPVRMAAGAYDASITRSNRFSKAAGHDVFLWEIHGVYDGERLRQGIRLHAANYATQLEGCLSLGMARIDIDGDGVLDVAQSRRALQLFSQACGADTTMEVIVTDLVAA